MDFRTIENDRLVDGAKIDNLPNDTIAELSLKADKSTTYTKTETNTEIDNAIAGIDMSSYVTDTELTSSLSGKQNTLVSGTNIKTINGDSLLGSGNLVIGGLVVDSVNGETGIVVLNQDDILDGTIYKQYSSTEKTKLALIEAGAEVNTVNPGDLPTLTSDLTNDSLLSDITAGTNITIDKTDPLNPIINSTATSATTLNELTDVIITTPTNGQSLTYNGTEWVNSTSAGVGDMLKTENLSGLADYATARTNLGLDTTANQTDSTDKRFMTDAQEDKLDAISGTNTGDQDLSGLALKSTTITINGDTQDLSSDRSWIISTSGELTYSNVTSSQAITPGNYYGVTCTDNITLTLADGTAGQNLSIKKLDNTTYTITITGNIEGETSIVMDTQNESLDLFWNGTYYLIK